MPTYEYQCPKCGKVYEAVRKVEERETPVHCDACNVDAVRIMSGFASKIGFYVRPPVPKRPSSGKASES